MKLRCWPRPRTSVEEGMVCDLDWSWIKTLPGERVGELRIGDTIGGLDNLRIIFFVADEYHKEGEMPVIWVLAVLQKRKNDFTANEVRNFKARKTLIVERFYRNPP